MELACYVYIMTNKSKTLYTGVTNDLHRRVWEHKQKLAEGFTKKYNITRLVYYEESRNLYYLDSSPGLFLTAFGKSPGSE